MLTEVAVQQPKAWIVCFETEPRESVGRNRDRVFDGVKQLRWIGEPFHLGHWHHFFNIIESYRRFVFFLTRLHDVKICPVKMKWMVQFIDIWNIWLHSWTFHSQSNSLWFSSATTSSTREFNGILSRWTQWQICLSPMQCAGRLCWLQNNESSYSSGCVSSDMGGKFNEMLFTALTNKRS